MSNEANTENKSGKLRRVGRGGGGWSKLKETEQEEQLKVQRSVINNLERKLGEVEN